MKKGVYTDTGSRMRLNRFKKYDGVVREFDGTNTKTFYDYLQFNVDSYEIGNIAEYNIKWGEDRGEECLNYSTEQINALPWSDIATKPLC